MSRTKLFVTSREPTSLFVSVVAVAPLSEPVMVSFAVNKSPFTGMRVIGEAV